MKTFVMGEKKIQEFTGIFINFYLHILENKQTKFDNSRRKSDGLFFVRNHPELQGVSSA